ncbi:MAG: hypothetical protein HYT39_03085 [Candidatus Sungbacteria bacterium]|nr:hypothetical protein [Candidatus Sungbacteria bacterium]
MFPQPGKTSAERKQIRLAVVAYRGLTPLSKALRAIEESRPTTPRVSDVVKPKKQLRPARSARGRTRR